MLVNANDIEYALISQSMGRIVIPEPRNYEDGNGNIYTRDKESKGFLTTSSNELEFILGGRDAIKNQIATRGIAEDLLLQKRIKDPYRLDERWITRPPVYLDLGTDDEDEEKNTIKVKSTQGGLFKVIKSNLNEGVDLLSNTSIGGVDVGVLGTVAVPVPGRDILRISDLSIEDGTRVQNTVGGGDNLTARVAPFNVDVNSDAEDITTVQTPGFNAASGNYARPVGANTSNFWYTIADQATTLTLNGRIEVRIVDSDVGTFTLDLVRYKNGDAFDYDEKINLDTINPNQIGRVASFDFVDYVIEVDKGDSLTFGVLTNTNDGVGYEYYNSKFTVREDSRYPQTQCRAITPFNVGERLVAKLTGQRNSFKSNMLSNGGIHANKLLTQGYWAREFPDVIQEGTDEERKILFSTSMKDFLQHLDAIDPIAWWVERDGDREVMRIEQLKYTQQNFIGIRFGETRNETFLGENRNDNFLFIQAESVRRKTLKDNFYGSMEFGSEKGGEDYEEVSGLQSISGKASFSTINSKTSDSTYKRLSPYRLGDIDVELARRKPYSIFPEEDTRYDSDIMCLDCKVINGSYYLRQWQDVYETAPLNVYSVDTLFNPEFTPARFLLNHSYVINAGLYHYPGEKVRFNTSNCNSSFISKKASEDFVVKESPEINDVDYGLEHTWFELPRINPKSVDFVLPVDERLEDQITGYSNGLQNWFGLVAVKIRGGIEYMRLVETNTNKEGTHKLVEAFIDRI